MNSDSNLSYDLFGIICHDGSLNSGHYYSYIKIESKWYLFNDSQVSSFDESRISDLKSNSYILIYKQKNHIFTESQYFKMINYAINQNDKKEPETSYFIGEPVTTDKGLGYIESIEKKTNIKNGDEIITVRQKTGELMNIPVNDEQLGMKIKKELLINEDLVKDKPNTENKSGLIEKQNSKFLCCDRNKCGIF